MVSHDPIPLLTYIHNASKYSATEIFYEAGYNCYIFIPGLKLEDSLSPS